MSNFGCVYEESLINIKNNHSWDTKSAGHLINQDFVFSPCFNEFKKNDDIYSWSSTKISDLTIKESVVDTVFIYKHPKIIYFNKDTSAKFSLEQPVLIQRNKTFYFLTTAMIQPGDTLVRFEPTTYSIKFEPVVYIDIEEGNFTTYNFYVEPYILYMVNGLIVASK